MLGFFEALDLFHECLNYFGMGYFHNVDDHF